MNKYLVDGRYGDLLAFFGINMEEVLKKAQLPGDAFQHRTVTMREEDYYRFVETVGSFIKDPSLAIQIATTNKIETFSPPIFASYCSKNAEVCLERLAQYKRLIGPMVMRITKAKKYYSFPIPYY